MRNVLRVFFHSTPSLVAISLLELVNIQVYIHGPISQGTIFLIAWLSLQMIPGFLFGYLSDKHYRKKILVASQLLGLIGGLVLLTFGFKTWVLVFVALTFNPLPVARAAFLDNFAKYSSLKIIAVTFLAQQFPWLLFGTLSKLHYKTTIIVTLCILGINALLTILFFYDKHDKSKYHSVKIPKEHKSKLFLTLAAFIFAEAAFYLLWSFLEETPNLQNWQGIATFGTVVGISIALFYHRLPHISVITLFYGIGAAIVIAVLYRCYLTPGNCIRDYLISMSNYTVIGGIYLPFVTDSVISLYGSERKALGSAMIEFADTVAAFLGPILGLAFMRSEKVIIVFTLMLLLLATLFQRAAEKKHLGITSP